MRFSLDSRRCVSALVGVLIFVFAVGLVAFGYQLAKHRYNKPFDIKVERDTVTAPSPLRSSRQRRITDG